jgi:RNA polymerase sigma-70 factor (ECF subfamily)
MEEAHTAEAATNPAHELRLDLEKALTQLHPLETAAIVHCFHGGLSHNQAAEVLGLPLGTLKSHLSRGRSKLQVLLADWRPANSP